LLEESMRTQGWTGGRMEERRRILEQRMKKKGKRKEIREDVGKILGIDPDWWRKGSELSDSDSDSEEEEEESEDVYVSAPCLTIILDGRRTCRRRSQIIQPCLSFLHPYSLKYSSH